MDSDRLVLGPFELTSIIGQGGMGEVWKGVHSTLGTPVAVKVLTAGVARDEFHRTAFQNEVRAVAGLNHPQIVLIYDYGEVSESLASRAGGRLVAGSPWLAMELLDGGAITALCGSCTWPQARDYLLQLLDALAHAHARGVIHRDIKPPNVLLDQGRGQVRLTDFGLAHAADFDPETADEDGSIIGTPAFMAPEQFEDRRRDFGPWTDLYSLGCLAFALVSGKAPFGTAGSFSWFRELHTRRPRPSLPPDTNVPPGVEDWIHRLLEIEPEHRFHWAADAARALLEIPVHPDEKQERAPETGALTTLQDLATLPLEEERGEEELGVEELPFEALQELDAQDLEPLARSELHPPEMDPTLETVEFEPIDSLEPGLHFPPVPRTWRRRQGVRASVHLLGAGLGLYAVRTVPVVGREAERDALWNALRLVHRQRRSHVVLLDGPVGAGKSRLAEWLCERAHELGNAQVMRADHAPVQSPNESLASMVARHYRCVGMSRDRVLKRLRSRLRAQGVVDPDEWFALTEYLSPATDEDWERGIRVIRFESGVERHALIRRVLVRATRRRPVVVWFDDVHWGLETLVFLSRYLQAESTDPSAVLFVLTAREDVLADRRAEARQLAALMRMEHTARLTLGPLESSDHAALVRELLGLESELAARVQSRTAGNPQFAVQLVGDWVHRGLLEPGEMGFRLVADAEVDLPDSLHDVWKARLDEILAGWSSRAARSLEVAAVLGMELDPQEWVEACHALDLEPARRLVEALFRRRLARTVEGRPGVWAFAHAMLRESLVRRAREAGRLESLHLACAAVLRHRTGAAAVERLGRHLVAGGAHEEALAPLARAAELRLAAGDSSLAGILLGERQQALENLGLAPEDPRWGRGWVLWAWYARMQGDLEQAHAWASRAVEAGRRHGWTEVRARAQLERGRIARSQGDLGQAWRRFEGAAELAVIIGNRNLEARCQLQLGLVRADTGDLVRAKAALRAAREDFAHRSDRLEEARCRMGLAEVARKAGDPERSREHLEAAKEAFQEMGARANQAEAAERLGDLARSEDRLERAETLYRNAHELYQAVGLGPSHLLGPRLGLLEMARERPHQARQRFVESLHAVERTGLRSTAVIIYAGLLAVSARFQEWTAMSHHARRLRGLLEETGIAEPDVAELARAGGRFALEAGHFTHAREAMDIAIGQWRAMGRTEEANALVAILVSLRQGSPTDPRSE